MLGLALTQSYQAVRTASSSPFRLPSSRAFSRKQYRLFWIDLSMIFTLQEVLCFNSCSLNGEELTVLTAWYDWVNANLSIDLDLIVYLRTSPDVAHSRLKKRGRKEEAGVPLTFIESLHNSYENWLIKETRGP